MSIDVHYSKLMNAAGTGDIGELKKYIEEGVSPDFVHPVGGNTILQLACQLDKIDSIKLLLKCGADPNKKITQISRIDGHLICKDAVALMFVTSVSAAELLITHGGSHKVTDGEGNSVRDWFIKHRETELVNYYDSLENS